MIIQYGICVLQGNRPLLEDSHTILTPFLPEDKNSFFFAIYDGHGGNEIAYYAAANVHQFVAQAYQNCQSMEQALVTGIKRADSALKNTQYLNERAQSSGSTAIIVVIKDNKLYVANVGDSRALLSRAGKVIPLSVDHKPNREDEKQRIEQAGGNVNDVEGIARVNGNLAISRSIGDHALRDAGIIATPEITVTTLTDEDDFILLACDGVFESQTKIDNELVISIIQQSLNENKHTCDKAEKAAKLVANLAYTKGSGDNISVLVITLK